jgi:uncharacterized spore protein YtfJ
MVVINMIPQQPQLLLVEERGEICISKSKFFNMSTLLQIKQNGKIINEFIDTIKEVIKNVLHIIGKRKNSTIHQWYER